MGFFGSLSKGWDFIGQAFRMARQNKSLLKPSFYQLGLAILYWAAWIGVFVGADIDPESGTGAALGIAATLGSFIIHYFFSAVTVNMVDAHLRQGEVSVKEGVRDARQNFFAILCLAVISTIVEVFANAARHGDGDGAGNIVLSIIGSMVQAIWTVVAFLLLPSIMIEDISLGKALKRVRQLHKGNFLLIGIGEVGVRGVLNLIFIPVFLLLLGLGYVSFEVMGGTGGTVVGILSIGTILSIFISFAMYFRMAYYTCLYLWATEVEQKGPEQAKPPMPLARALKLD